MAHMIKKDDIIKMLDALIGNLSERDEEAEVVLLILKNKIQNMPEEKSLEELADSYCKTMCAGGCSDKEKCRFMELVNRGKVNECVY